MLELKIGSIPGEPRESVDYTTTIGRASPPSNTVAASISSTELTGRQSLQSKLALIFTKRVPFTGQRHRPVALATQTIKLKKDPRVCAPDDGPRSSVQCMRNVDYSRPLLGGHGRILGECLRLAQSQLETDGHGRKGAVLKCGRVHFEPVGRVRSVRLSDRDPRLLIDEISPRRRQLFLLLLNEIGNGRFCIGNE
ncbi:hypothetical protein GEV33_004381 [Tenebrio molitor]|uniref:Uncharacterized protein n=1 Tax=Tenebrio molitor TaxID=7067 RepID=A0A8J6HGK7_TENMO|nr:hypothetical protein GEV33_004381 [Tenebrio molitor]